MCIFFQLEVSGMVFTRLSPFYYPLRSPCSFRPKMVVGKYKKDLKHKFQMSKEGNNCEAIHDLFMLFLKIFLLHLDI